MNYIANVALYIINGETKLSALSLSEIVVIIGPEEEKNNPGFRTHYWAHSHRPVIDTRVISVSDRVVVWPQIVQWSGSPSPRSTLYVCAPTQVMHKYLHYLRHRRLRLGYNLFFTNYRAKLNQSSLQGLLGIRWGLSRFLGRQDDCVKFFSCIKTTFSFVKCYWNMFYEHKHNYCRLWNFTTMEAIQLKLIVLSKRNTCLTNIIRGRYYDN